MVQTTAEKFGENCRKAGKCPLLGTAHHNETCAEKRTEHGSCILLRKLHAALGKKPLHLLRNMLQTDRDGEIRVHIFALRKLCDLLLLSCHLGVFKLLGKQLLQCLAVKLLGSGEKSLGCRALHLCLQALFAPTDKHREQQQKQRKSANAAICNGKEREELGKINAKQNAADAVYNICKGEQQKQENAC